MEEERGGEILSRKMTLQMIEERKLRKACYKKRREGLLKKMKEITTVCDIDACVIIHSPDDDEAVPTVWPSPEVAKQLLQRFQSIPETQRCKRMVDHHSFIQEKVKRMNLVLTRLREFNEEKQMSIFMYQLCYEGKPVSDFNLDETKRLLNYVDEKLKAVRLRMSIISEEVSDTKFGGLNGGSDDLLILPSQRDDFGSRFTGRGSDDDSIVSFHGNFGGLINGDLNGQSGLEMLPQSNFEGFISGNDSIMLSDINSRGIDNDESGLGMMLSESKFGGFNGENNLGMLPQNNFGGLNNGACDLGCAPQSKFEVHNAAMDSLVFAQDNNNFDAPIVENDDLMGVPQLFNSIGINGEENLGVLHGSLATSENGGSSKWAPYGIGSAICGNDGLEIEQKNEIYNGSINNIAGLQQFNPSNFGVNNSEALMGEFNPIFLDPTMEETTAELINFS